MIGADLGSSPLTRGKSSDEIGRGVVYGLIPAHAGKITHAVATSGSRRAHPRSRGENASGEVAGERVGGSSPLTRGKSRRGRGPPRPRGLIPAHAGKMPPTSATCIQTKAHPRSRGENLKCGCLTVAVLGSSPLTRGKSRPSRRRRRHSRAHPRSRGENTQAAGSCPTPAGSSPLTRGKSRRRCPLGNADGLIPAHAGKIR